MMMVMLYMKVVPAVLNYTIIIKRFTHKQKYIPSINWHIMVSIIFYCITKKEAVAGYL